METVLAKLPKDVYKELRCMLEDAVEISHASKGMLHISDQHKDLLLIVSHIGLDSQFVEHFRKIKPFDSSACGRAVGTGNVVFIDDITKDIGCRPHLSVNLSNNIKSVQSTPLFFDGILVGVLTVHFNEKPEKTIRTQPIKPGIAGLLYEIFKQKEDLM